MRPSAQIGRGSAVRVARAQATLEFVVIVGVTLGVVLMLFLFLGTFLEYAHRILRLVALEYP